MRIFILCLFTVAFASGCIRSGASVTPKGAVAVAQPTGGLSAGIAPDLNAFRVANGQAPLAADARLARAAQLHADDMSAKTYFSHKGQDGSSAGDRVKREGYG